MSKWTPTPKADDYKFDAHRVTQLWARLHRCDAEPLPEKPELLAAWALFHSGDFEAATHAGLALGDEGATLANKATCIYANYVEPHEKTRLDLFMAAAERAQALQVVEPDNANAWYWQAYAVGRYSQGISVAKALAMGLGPRMRRALEKALALSPNHADAHLAMGGFHAEVIDKVGEMVGRLTYGANRETGLAHFRMAHQLNPDSAITLAEYANGLLMLEGDLHMKDAMALIEQAAAFEPLDAMERLYVESARMDLGA